MKKLIAFVLTLVSVLALVGCSNTESKLIHKTYTGEITEITDTSVTIIYYGGANKEVTFSLSDETLDVPTDLMVGDEVTVESEYMTDAEQPYPAIMICRSDTDEVNE